jgi:hypothetical protein
MADIETTPPRKKRQRRPPLVGETKLFDRDPEVYVDTKAAVGMINAQFGAITSPADMGAMRISGTGPGFVKLGQYVRYKVSTLQSYYRAMLVEYSSTAQCKLMREAAGLDEAGPVNWSGDLQAFREVILNLAV